MVADRQDEYDRIRSLIDELALSGITVYKIALMTGQQYNTIKHWHHTGRVDSYSAKVLWDIHRKYCGKICQIDPQYVTTNLLP